MKTSWTIRRDLAARVADELLSRPDVIEVWLEGAVAEGFAHARSDVDLRVLVAGGPLAWGSRLVDGIRIDLDATDPGDLAPSRALLGTFEVHFDDVDTFRRVRGQLGLLTRLRTARRRNGGQWLPVLEPSECAVYRLWAVADRSEQVLSLAEDLLGLVADGMTAEADLVWHDMRLALAGLDCAVADQPLLSTKWLPALCARINAPDALAPGRLRSSEPDQPWFDATRARQTTALLRCWPLSGGADPELFPPEAREVGWLPQRYTDGWFLRRGDDRIPLTDAQMWTWSLAAIGPDRTAKANQGKG
ncbi:MAG: hypothetical protein H7Y15_04445 [Pseudonocardia sp.]|nr:hypothetical protein [Pseudonocardia sp.]